MRLMHNGLEDLLLIGEYIPDEKIVFFSLDTPLPEWIKNLSLRLPNYSMGLQVRREFRHISVALNAFKNTDADIIFIFEIFNQHLLLMLPLLALLSLQNKKIIMGLHGNQQFAMYSKIKYVGLLYLKSYLTIFNNLKVFSFEINDEALPEKYRLPKKSQLIIPHPIISSVQPTLQTGKRHPENYTFKIGIIGMIRPDKPIAQIIPQLKAYKKDTSYPVEFIMGTPSRQTFPDLEELGVKRYDTTKNQDYLKVLREIDILVVHYDRERYYYRASGVISDAGSCGCYIIASDYPVIRHQVNHPVKIGDTFQDFSEIPQLIDQAIMNIKQQGQDNHWIWREARTADKIASILFKNQ